MIRFCIFLLEHFSEKEGSDTQLVHLLKGIYIYTSVGCSWIIHGAPLGHRVCAYYILTQFKGNKKCVYTFCYTPYIPNIRESKEIKSNSFTQRALHAADLSSIC